MGMATFSSNSEPTPPVPPSRDRQVVALHPAGDHHGGFADHGIDFARHDGRSRLDRRQCNLKQPPSWAGAHPTQIVGNLGERDRDRPQKAGRFDHTIPGGLGFKMILGLGK